MRCLDALLPMLASDFNRSVGSAGAAVSAYALSYSACQLLHGPLGDRVGAYRVVAGAACLSAAAAAACALVSSLAGLIVFRFIAGSIAAAIGPLTLAWISRSFRADERSLALARMTAAAIAGTALGQAGGGVLGGNFGWPSVFVALSAIFAASGLALAMLARGRPEVLDHRPPSTREERRRTRPLPLLRRPPVRRVLAAVGVQGFALYLSLTYVGALLHDRFSVGPAQAGLLVSLYGLGGLAFVLAAPWLLKLSTTGLRAAVGGTTLGGGFVLLALSSSPVMAGASLFAVGFGFLMLHNVLQVGATDMAPDAPATSLSLFAAAAVLAQAFGAAVGGYLYDTAGPTAMCLASAAVLTGLGLTIRFRSVL